MSLRKAPTKLKKEDTWRSFQFSLSSDLAYSRVQAKIKMLLTDAVKSTAGMTLSLSSSSLSDMKESPVAVDEYDNIAMWEQEEKIMQKVKTVKQEEPPPVKKETTRRTGLRDLSSSIYTRDSFSESWSSLSNLVNEEATVRAEFDVSWCQLSAIPPEIGDLTWLQVCNFSDNQLSTVPDAIGHLIHLEILILSDNRITSLSPHLFELKNLKRLYLDHNRLTSFPREIGKLTSLEALVLDYNSITTLPIELHTCQGLQLLSLTENPIIFPPKQVLASGVPETREYLSNIANNISVNLRRANLVVLGPSGAGKSTVINQLLPKKLRKDKVTATNGLSMGTWSLAEKDKPTKFTFTTWDFSGNEMYMSLNQLLMSDVNTVFLLVWDMSQQDQINVLEYYLKTIVESPVILVGTHMDSLENAENVNNIVTGLVSRFEGEHPNIKSIATVSPQQGYDYLREKIESLTSQFMETKIPCSYLAMEEIIGDLRKRNGPPVISWKSFRGYLVNCGITQESQQVKAGQTLVSMGNILYFSSSYIRNLIILNPQWLYESIALVLNAKAEESTDNDLERIAISPSSLQSEHFQGYPIELCAQILLIMEYAKMSIPFLTENMNDMSSKSLVDRRSVVYTSLSSKRPSYFKFEVDEHAKRLGRTYKFNILHPDMICGLIRCVLQLEYTFTKTTPELFWKNGAVISDTHHNRALIEVISDTSISITVAGSKRPESLLRSIIDTVDLYLLNWYPDIEVRRMVSCTKCLGSKEEGAVYLFTLDELELAAMHDQQDIKCPVEGGQIAITMLLPDMLLTDKEDLHIDFKDLQITNKLGEGAFGVISEAKYQNKTYAVKQITKTTDEEKIEAFKEWYREVCAMSDMRHQNIVNMRGFCKSPYCIVMEFVPYGTLYDFLRKPEVSLTWELRIRIALDIAHAMQYMHKQSPSYLHRDLKSPNILMCSSTVNAPIIAKLADFGTAVQLIVPELRTRLVDQPLWLAPEVMKRQPYTEKSDVYAFGIILWELVTRAHPFDEFPFAQWMAQLEDAIVSGTRPSIPYDCLPSYRKLIQECWHNNPDHRPSFNTIVKILTQLSSSTEEEMQKKKAPIAIELQTYAFDMADSEDVIIRDELGVNIKWATLPKLIEAFTSTKYGGFGLVKEFLLTSLAFITEAELFKLLRQRYVGPPHDAPEYQLQAFMSNQNYIQSKVIDILTLWVKLDKGLPSDVLNDVQTFLAEKDNRSRSEYGNFSEASPSAFTLPTSRKMSLSIGNFTDVPATPDNTLRALLKKRLTTKKVAMASVLNKRNLSSNTSTFDLLPVDPKLIAEQLTSLEVLFLQSIRPGEFVKQGGKRRPSKRLRERTSTQLSAYVEWFSLVRDWAATEILKGETTQDRTQLIDKFINVAMSYYELRNFNGIMSILSCLHSDGIQSLISSWPDVPKKSLENIEFLSNLMGTGKDFKLYRETVTKDSNNYIPYLGIFIKDISFLEETSPWKQREMINIEKIANIGSILLDFVSVQKKAKKMQFNPQPKIRTYILTAGVWDEQDFVKMAQLKEELSQFNESIAGKVIKKRRNTSLSLDLDELSPKDWNILLTNSSIIKHKKNSIVFTEGSLNAYLYRVKSGKFRIEKKLPNGNVIVLNTVGVNTIFGEMSFLSNFPTSATVTSDEDGSELYVLEIPLVKKIFSTDPDLFTTFYQYLATMLAKRLKGAPSQSSQRAPTSRNLAKVEDKKEVKQEEDEFYKLFGLPETEFKIKEYPCQQKSYRGNMYITREHVCFYAKLFGIKKRKVVSMHLIKEVRKRERNGLELIDSRDKRKKYLFQSERERDDCFEILTSLWKSSTDKKLARTETERNLKTGSGQSEDPETLTKNDWDLLLTAAKMVSYEKNQSIVVEGEHIQRIYQIVSGMCRIEKNGIEKPLGTMEPGKTLGEISFLLSGGATASVVADAPTEVYILEGYCLNMLFSLKPELGGKFYKYLAQSLQTTLRTREQAKREE